MENKAQYNVQDHDLEITLGDIMTDNNNESIITWGEMFSHELLGNGSILDFTLDTHNESYFTLGSEYILNLDEL